MTLRPTLAAALALALALAAPVAAAPSALPAAAAPIVNPQPTAMGLLRCLAGQGVTLTSGHRAGPEPGYPENAIETLAHTLAQAPMLIEMDVRTSRDGVLLLMHDADLKRTTDGEGLVRATAWADIAKLRLEDDKGVRTDFRVPTVAEALQAMRGRGILVLDLKEDASIPAIAKAVADADARSYVVVNLYTPAQARAFHRIDPTLTLTLPVTGQADLEVLELVGVNLDNVVAWTGLAGIDERRTELWRALRARGMPVMYGTLFVADREPSAAVRAEVRRKLADDGVDVIPTDRHQEAFATLDARRSTAAGLAACHALAGPARR